MLPKISFRSTIVLHAGLGGFHATTFQVRRFIDGGLYASDSKCWRSAAPAGHMPVSHEAGRPHGRDAGHQVHGRAEHEDRLDADVCCII